VGASWRAGQAPAANLQIVEEATRPATLDFLLRRL